MTVAVDSEAVAMGKAVKGAIAQAGLSLHDVSSRTTMAPNTLSRRINGHSSFTWSELVQISGLTGVGCTELAATAVRIAESAEARV